MYSPVFESSHGTFASFLKTIAKVSIAFCLISSASAYGAMGYDGPYQPDGNFSSYHKSAKQVIPYGKATIWGINVPMFVVPIKNPRSSKSEYLYAPSTLRRSYTYPITKAEAKGLAVYVLGYYGEILAPIGMRVIYADQGVDGDGGIALSAGPGKWIEFNNEGACVGCKMATAFQWFPWVKDGFTANGSKAKPKYEMSYKRLDKQLTEVKYDAHGQPVIGLLRYVGAYGAFTKIFISYENERQKYSLMMGFDEKYLSRGV